MTNKFVQRCKQKIIIQTAVNGANEDLLPTQSNQRTWTWRNYSSLWAGQSFDATWWNVGCTLQRLLIGLYDDPKYSFINWSRPYCTSNSGPRLNWMPPSWRGRCAQCFIRCTLPCRIPRNDSPNFWRHWVEMVRRSAWVNRNCMVVYYSGQLMGVMFLCVFGSSYRDWDPIIPASAGTDAKTILVYFLSWTIAFPLTFIHPSKLRAVFATRAFFGGVAFFVMFIWCTSLGQMDPKGFQGFTILQTNPVSGSALGWAIMSGINSILGTTAPMITNQSDISRYARTPNQAGWPQGFTIFTTKTIMSFLSIVATASLQSRYGGIPLWNIWDQLHLILDNNWNAHSRFGCFIIALGVSYSVVVTNAYCNAIPFGADIAAIFPRYFNIVRGQVFIAFISLPVLPWQILTNAQAFLTFLGSYTFLMGSLLGCQWGDFIIRKGNYHVPSMYNYSKDCIYMYIRGYNWRGFTAWFISFCIIFPGLIAAYVPDKMSIAPRRIYSMGWIIGVFLSMFCYIGLVKLFPVPAVPEEHVASPAHQKWLGMSPIHGYFPGDTIDGADTASNHGSSITEDNEKSKDFVIEHLVSV